ncbi:PREDICTED: vegetative cell wall protein gp1-like [Chinchilla lanigera]|uniref:vegetative cell wall protein gp1-like n=1 Tax=Chinchilla lanigera TaxID=34839 RepID=UPI000698B9FA|nr:PREDICTED: vegetative cell wall protein gp1-like [Chinchilla lanigera]
MGLGWGKKGGRGSSHPGEGRLFPASCELGEGVCRGESKRLQMERDSPAWAGEGPCRQKRAPAAAPPPGAPFKPESGRAGMGESPPGPFLPFPSPPAPESSAFSGRHSPGTRVPRPARGWSHNRAYTHSFTRTHARTHTHTSKQRVWTPLSPTPGRGEGGVPSLSPPARRLELPDTRETGSQELPVRAPEASSIRAGHFLISAGAASPVEPRSNFAGPLGLPSPDPASVHPAASRPCGGGVGRAGNALGSTPAASGASHSLHHSAAPPPPSRKPLCLPGPQFPQLLRE